MFLTRGLDVVMCDGFPVIDKVFLQGQRRGKLQERQSHRSIIACCLFVYGWMQFTPPANDNILHSLNLAILLNNIIKVAEVPLDDDFKQRVHTSSGNIR